jgi:hypothetical protein
MRKKRGGFGLPVFYASSRSVLGVLAGIEPAASAGSLRIKGEN